MPRKNFLSKATFVDASEKLARETILSIPAFIPSIKLLADNKRIESFKFSYEQPVKQIHYHIDVSVLPLNDQYTRISLHATYANGHAFTTDAEVAVALHDFESAIQAALKGELAQFNPYQSQTNPHTKFSQFISSCRSSMSVFFLRKKLS
jgi:hypothetical protein